jgi:hypothetical protein
MRFMVFDRRRAPFLVLDKLINKISFDNFQFDQNWLLLLMAILLSMGCLCTQPAIWDTNTFNDDNRISSPGFFITEGVIRGSDERPPYAPRPLRATVIQVMHDGQAN